ncbi:hypothetical protein [Amycolatopsis sp. cmx-11-51]|uniref:hypothetical protein n=1 Tax=Amycolatopsis sp. cmx-11-51 TaxID=2785797 RepID=UPI0039E3614E
MKIRFHDLRADSVPQGWTEFFLAARFLPVWDYEVMALDAPDVHTLTYTGAEGRPLAVAMRYATRRGVKELTAGRGIPELKATPGFRVRPVCTAAVPRPVLRW